MNVMKEYEALRDAFRLVGVDLKLFEDGVKELGYEYSASGYLPDVVIGKRRFSHLMIVLSFGDNRIYFDVCQMIHESHPHVDDTIMCLDENAEELRESLINKEYIDFATRVISAIGEYTDGGQYRTPSHTWRCSRCNEWNERNERPRMCNCESVVGCNECITNPTCDMCHRYFGPYCDHCQDDELMPTLVDDVEMMVCNRCRNHIANNTRVYCPDCAYLRRVESTCEKCGGVILECQGHIGSYHDECFVRSKT